MDFSALSWQPFMYRFRFLMHDGRVIAVVSADEHGNTRIWRWVTSVTGTKPYKEGATLTRKTAEDQAIAALQEQYRKGQP
jgi:hypothetical protein